MVNQMFRLQFVTLLILTLIFSHPFVILAQQNSAEIQAKRDAETDANTDVNSLIWAGVGFTAPFLGCLGCIVGAQLAADANGTISGSGDRLTGLGTGISNACGVVFLGGSIGFMFGSSMSMIPVYYYPISPPAVRLLGKTPEYVQIYTSNYTTNAKKNRVEAASVGACIGTGSLLLLMLYSLVAEN